MYGKAIGTVIVYKVSTDNNQSAIFAQSVTLKPS